MRHVDVSPVQILAEIVREYLRKTLPPICKYQGQLDFTSAAMERTPPATGETGKPVGLIGINCKRLER